MELEKKIKELTEKYKCKIHGVALNDFSGNSAYAFFRHPDRKTAWTVLSKTNNNDISYAGTLLFESCFLKEESDVRIMIENAPIDKIEECDALYLGAMNFCLYNIVLVALPKLIEEKKN
jgi:hypothetical protein